MRPKSLILLVLALLAGTAAAFGVTETLKTSPSPILQTQVAKTFSPVCGCDTRTARIAFRLRRADRVVIAIQDSRGRTVRVLFSSRRRVPAGVHEWAWNGRLDGGARAPDGVYRPRVELEDADRAIVLPNRIALDTRPPQVTIVGTPRLGGPGALVVHYRLDEPARGLLTVGGVSVARTYRVRLDYTLRLATATLAAAGARSGPVTLAAEDLAGNRSAPQRIGVRR